MSGPAIPEEIWEAARALRSQVNWSSNNNIKIIARALMAARADERKRCAEIAREHASSAERRDGDYWGAASEAEAIAAAIETYEETKSRTLATLRAKQAMEGGE